MVYAFEDFELDTELYELRRSGRRISVEPQVFDVIAYLLGHRDRVVPKTELFENIWKTRFVTESALTSRIKAARRALEDTGREQRLIGTVHGRGYRFLGEVEERDSRPPPDRRRGVTGQAGSAGLLVGRDRERRRLHELLADALGGSRRIVVVTGEAGIGKTTTIRAFLDQAVSDHDVLVAAGQCLEHQGPSEPFMPLFDALDRLCRDHPELLRTLARCGPNWLVEMPWLVEDAQLAMLARSTVGNTRYRMLREMVETLVTISEGRPLVLVLEDLQWSDPSTLDALNALARSPAPSRLLVVSSCRTGDLADPSRPAAALLHELRLRGLCEELVLPPLTEQEVEGYLRRRLPGMALPERFGRFLHKRTDGNPLFMEVVVDDFTAGVERGQPGEAAPFPTKVPETLKRVIERRWAGLSQVKREVLEAAAVAGTDTSAALIARALDASEEEVEVVCEEIARKDQFLRPGKPLGGSPTSPPSSGFAFAHALYQEVIYEQMPSARRARLHGAVGRALEASYGSRVAERAGELAFHFTLARQALPAVTYLHMAAGQALRRYAYKEAIGHLTTALRLVEGIEPQTSLELEIVLRDMLALGLIMVEGWSHLETELELKKALELSERLGDADRQSLLLYHLAAVYENRGEHEKSKEVLERRLLLHPHFRDSTSLLESHELLACSLFHKGEFGVSLDHADKGSALYNPERHLALLAATMGENLGVSCHSWAALDLWYLGYPERARQRMNVALDLAKDPQYAYCLARTEERAAILHELLGEPEGVLEHAVTAIDLGRRQGHELCVATGRMLAGWAHAALGDAEAGLTQLRSGLASYEASGSRIGLPYFFGLLADALLRADLPAGALIAAGDGLREVGDRGFSHEAELLRLKGLAMAALGQHDEALDCLRRAVRVAHAQRALSLELRALASLASHASGSDEASTALRLHSSLEARLRENSSVST